MERKENEKEIINEESETLRERREEKIERERDRKG